jgi:hypothetical protein
LVTHAGTFTSPTFTKLGTRSGSGSPPPTYSVKGGDACPPRVRQAAVDGQLADHDVDHDGDRNEYKGPRAEFLLDVV